MKENDDIFNKFRDSFSKLNGHFHVLEQRVPVEQQMEYFKYSEQVRSDNKKELANIDFMVLQDDLLNPDSSSAHKKYLLSVLASSRMVKAYRMLEDYVQNPDPEVRNWAYMALMESRIALESELSDEKQIYISTGLGGRGEKLRFFVLMLSNEKQDFQEYQRKVIEREFPYFLEKSNCDIERIFIGERHVELLLLIPVRADIKQILDQVIMECNEYGNFLAGVFTITNVKELTKDEIAGIINKHEGNSKASH